MKLTKTAIYCKKTNSFLGPVIVDVRGNVKSRFPAGAEVLEKLFKNEKHEAMIRNRVQFGGSIKFEIAGVRYEFDFKEEKGVHAQRISLSDVTF